MSESAAEVRSGFWKYALVLVSVLAMSALVMLGLPSYKMAPPIADQVVSPDGTQVSTGDLIRGGQAVYLKNGLANYGSVMGDGSYRGPDFTAETLRLTVDAMRDYLAQQRYGQPYKNTSAEAQAAIAQQVIQEIQTNRYDAATKTLTLTASQVYALQAVEQYYTTWFEQGDAAASLRAGLVKSDVGNGTADRWITADAPLTQLAHYFYWTAWAASTHRPGEVYSYTNNWPYEPDAGNTVTVSSVLYSALSVALLLLILTIILWAFHRYRLSMESATGQVASGSLPVLRADSYLAAHPTPSQKAVGKYAVLVMALFLVQTLLGGYLAHGYLDVRFFGIDLQRFLPFNVARTWHLQLAIFWIATAWVAMGMYIAPVLSRGEVRGQRAMVNILFGALIVVAVGSLAGEWLSVQGMLGKLWWWLGTQGWEYIELGRLWQILLAVGLTLWLFIVYRGIKGALKKPGDSGSLVHLLLYASVLIPAFYLFGFINLPHTNVSIAEYWRWFVIHLWVEGIFEVFTVVVTAVLFVTMGLVSERSALRATYFQLLLIMGSGVIGTAHHYYFVGLPEFWIALGATFSALEVIPLTLLGVEAWEQWQLVKKQGKEMPHQITFWFLIATALWNLFGAGVLGFLINLPVVNYFEHGSFLTAAHGHGALAGVYGMLAMALITFVARDLTTKRNWHLPMAKLGFWGLNIGLAGMILITIVPVGIGQLETSMLQGFWAARGNMFYHLPWVRALLWARLLPDSVLIALGVLPSLYVVGRAILNPRRADDIEETATNEIQKVG